MEVSEAPLAGIKVIEFSHMVMGPATGLILADLGAEVVKIEPLGGDKTRQLGGSGAGYYPMYNRNKRSVCLDLKSGEGKAVALELISQADVLIENFRPGAMERLGFGYDDCRERHAGLIYCSLKGFLSGPYEKRTALDEVTQMMGGLAYMTGLPDRPLRAGSSVIDITGGMFGVIAILAALEERHRTGRGQRVSSALFETTAFLVGQHMAQEGVLGEPPPPMSVRRSAWSIYDIFECAEDGRVFVGVVSDGLWQRFCDEFGLDELGADPGLAGNTDRVTQRERILEVIVPLFRGMSVEEACERLERAGIPFAPINRPTDLFDDPHLNTGGGLLPVSMHRGVRMGEAVKLPALPVEMDGERPALRRDLARPGEDTLAVLRESGLSEDDIDRLRQAGVIG
ncbi:MAG: CaiB/BaiF CoA-transferase family protein [Xanthomonadales bacterium]|jgi:crotonobetainyl-CoA:carnitine CoA-transferase CaiB-like acyl-CoA transferase|nr:CaiB/BaiF CoA-transferase family protein [Xanthomonadales bacterium]